VTQPIVIDRHAGYEIQRSGRAIVCDCGWSGADWDKHRQSSEPLGPLYRVTTVADTRNQRELRRIWDVEARDAPEAQQQARMAHAQRVGGRGVWVVDFAQLPEEN
jgi:hypothetical protein